ncbi:MAG: NAD-glutamate dehydrogenase [Gammaproteobacteria bacterium]|nr:NAD-glutamate dehydrogenase [Gammaproteobacteria bacterium]
MAHRRTPAAPEQARIPPGRRQLIQRIGRAGARHRLVPPGEVAAYYAGVDEQELARRPPRHWAALLAAHRRFGAIRRAGEVLVRVFNPQPRADGFDVPHSCVLVVTDDMPFLLDSLGMVFEAAAVPVHLIVHPVLGVRRSSRGRLRTLGPAAGAAAPRESWQFFEIDRQADAAACAVLAERLQRSLRDVALAVRDWSRMRRRMRVVAATLGAPPRGAQRREFAEARALLEWMEAGQFVFLGYRYHRLLRARAGDVLHPEARSGLGILRASAPRPAAAPYRLTGAVRERARARHPLVLTKATSFSTVHRAAYLDYVGVKAFDHAGRVVGEHRFLGLWTSTAYHCSPREIPLLRRKVEQVVAHFGLAAPSHDAKALVSVLETYPRDELFQASVPELIRSVRAVVNLYERRTVRLLLRADPFGRFRSCMVYVPRDRYTSEVRHRIEGIVRAACGGRQLETQVQISESSHARLQMLVRVESACAPPVDVAALETAIAAATRTWADRLLEALGQHHDAVRARALLARYAAAFPPSYQDDVEPAAALADIAALERLQLDTPGALMLALRRAVQAGRLHLRIVRHGEAIAISALLPVLENFGLRVLGERSYRVGGLPGGAAAVQDFELEYPAGALDVDQAGARFEAALLSVWRGELENDGFNRLLFAAGLEGREIVVLRACCRYLLQAGVPFSRASMERALLAEPRSAALLLRLFRESFDPDLPARGRETRRRRVLAQLDARFERIGSADDDRILRGCAAVLAATLRTNYYCRGADGRPPATLALKFNARQIGELPQPRPHFEIYVYSPEVEGVHLRMGAVARGGLRWSDRRDDFRTEVLGLMKAQNVKNTLIVPAGAKGGFVPRRLQPGMERDAQQRFGIAAYRQFIGALLDVTDNIERGHCVPPPRVVRRDHDDPYLVVAADKGTAGFSDIANGIACERGFWLGDAFASGGSAGYDHKALGITARGAWECVKRHFRELGVDADRDAISVAGIGDMSGDVFGNGLLRSAHIRLVAAFNHQHIFLDPAPDPARSHAERRRLFRLPRSGWNDYDRRLISRGGGVWPRAAKRIELSGEAQRLLGLAPGSLTPSELVRAILRMPADLLWNGGIGTYVKAHDESHLEAGDRSNDALRVNGAELRARVVGEGGNLGFTQRGRIEYALAGGRINTDFVDNSAGVNTSDFEVNIKILLDGQLRAGRLAPAARRRLLASMASEVGALVLRNNYLQSQAISTQQALGRAALPAQQQTIRALERFGGLDRALEGLPDDASLAERATHGPGLTRPELAVMLAYSKIWLKAALLDSDVPEDAYFAREIERYFPAAVRRRYRAALRRHRLRREIVVTATVNSLVHRMGPGFVPRTQESSGARPAAIARAYTIARELFDARALWARIEALDRRVAAELQYRMMARIAMLLAHASEALLHARGADLPVERLVRTYRRAVGRLAEQAGSLVRGLERERYEAAVAEYAAARVPPALARRLAACEALEAACELADLARERRVHIADAGAVFFEAGAVLWLDGLRAGIDALEVQGPWQSQAQSGLRHGLRALRLHVTAGVLGRPARGTAAVRVAAWLAARGAEGQRWVRTAAELRNAGRVDFATLSAALEAVRRLAGMR